MEWLKRLIYFMVLLIFSAGCGSSKNPNMKTLYDYKVTDIDGNEFDFNSLKGKKVLIVNTASKCGFTPQFEGLEKLYEQYKDRDFVIVGFPSNDFGNQDPGSNEEIAEFCRMNYGVSFPMMEKIHVKGENQAAIYQFLTQKELNGKKNSTVRWNFQKYLINPDGSLENYYYSITKPESKKIKNWIEKD